MSRFELDDVCTVCNGEYYLFRSNIVAGYKSTTCLGEFELVGGQCRDGKWLTSTLSRREADLSNFRMQILLDFIVLGQFIYY